MTNGTPPAEGSYLGEVRGTHVGTAFMRVLREDGREIADLRVNIAGEITVFDGVVRPGPPARIEITRRLAAGEGADQQVTGVLTVDSVVDAGFSSSWELSSGAMGVANWFRHGTAQAAQPQQVAPRTVQPIQLVSREASIGAVTMYRSEFEGLIQKLRDLFRGASEPVVAATIDRRKVIQYARDLLARTDLPSTISECTVSLSDAASNERNSVVINLRRDGDNNIVVQGWQEEWPTGVSVDLADFMNRYTSVGTGAFRKYGLNVNGLMLLLAIIVIPDLGIVQRVIFFSIIIALALVFRKAHALVPNTAVYLDDTRRNPLRRQWPTIFSTVLAGAIVGLLSWLFSFLSTTDLAEWIRSITGP